MSKRTPNLYFQDILTAIQDIQEYTQGVSYEAFQNDKKTVDAVTRKLEIIGEAASHMPIELRTKYPDLPWEKMTSMRNKVLHEYFGIDIGVIWQTITEDLEPLKEKIKGLPELSNTSNS